MYDIPTMEEIRALPWNGLNVASTFSGCGGSSLGYRMAGARVLYANEFIPEAAETYRANAADYTHVDTRDIRTVTAADILAGTGLDVGELDLFDGSPPCSAFSTAGKGAKGYGKAKSYSDTGHQVVDDLFFEYARLLKDLQPKAFVAENVKGLTKGAAKGYFLRILAELRAAGYDVKAKVLNAAWLGVPQARERLIFVGIRKDLVTAPPFPAPHEKIPTINDAMAYLQAHDLWVGPVDGWVDPETRESVDIRRFSIARQWYETGQGQNHPKRFSLAVPHPNRPIPTITATTGVLGAAGVCHWDQPRKLNLREMRALSGVPRDFVLTGTYTQRAERLGRLVPPLMMREIATPIFNTLQEAK